MIKYPSLILMVLALLVSSMLVSTPSFASGGSGLAKVCKKVAVANVGSYIFKTSAPLRAVYGNNRSRITGKRYEPTLIMKKRENLSRTTIFTTSGIAIGSCPWAQADGAAGGRYRCTMQSRALTASARRLTGNPYVLFQVKGGCVKVNSSVCLGSRNC